MTSRPALLRSIPFWALLVGSLAVAAIGLWIVVDKLGVMETALTEQTATGVEVYVGQSWAVVGAVLLGAGVIGLALTLALAAASSFVGRRDAAFVEEIDWTADENDTPAPYTAPASTRAANADTALGEDPDVETTTSAAPVAATLGDSAPETPRVDTTPPAAPASAASTSDAPARDSDVNIDFGSTGTSDGTDRR